MLSGDKRRLHETILFSTAKIAVAKEIAKAKKEICFLGKQGFHALAFLGVGLFIVLLYIDIEKKARELFSKGDANATKLCVTSPSLSQSCTEYKPEKLAQWPKGNNYYIPK